jgi:hypothetical protein
MSHRRQREAYLATEARRTGRLITDVHHAIPSRWNGPIATRREFIRSEVARGARVARTGPDRRLQLISGGFYNVRDLTKIGMDFAEFLIAKKAAK